MGFTNVLAWAYVNQRAGQLSGQNLADGCVCEGGDSLLSIVGWKCNLGC